MEDPIHLLEKLHWLPVSARIDYKICSITFQCLNNPSFPTYLSELLSPYAPSRPLRSATLNKLVKPKTNLKTYGERAFSYIGPYLWNALPEEIKRCPSISSFKTNLKTFLFRKYFQ